LNWYDRLRAADVPLHQLEELDDKLDYLVDDILPAEFARYEVMDRSLSNTPKDTNHKGIVHNWARDYLDTSNSENSHRVRRAIEDLGYA